MITRAAVKFTYLDSDRLFANFGRISNIFQTFFCWHTRWEQNLFPRTGIWGKVDYILNHKAFKSFNSMSWNLKSDPYCLLLLRCQWLLCKRYVGRSDVLKLQKCHWIDCCSFVFEARGKSFQSRFKHFIHLGIRIQCGWQRVTALKAFQGKWNVSLAEWSMNELEAKAFQEFFKAFFDSALETRCCRLFDVNLQKSCKSTPPF